MFPSAHVWRLSQCSIALKRHMTTAPLIKEKLCWGLQFRALALFTHRDINQNLYLFSSFTT